MAYTRLTVAVVLCLLPCGICYISVPWQTQHFYGFDGPWQAVSVAISDIGATNEQTLLDLLPGSLCNLYAMTTEYCATLGEGNGSDLSNTAINPSSCTLGSIWSPQYNPLALASNCNIGAPIMNFSTIPGGPEIAGSLLPQSTYISGSSTGRGASMSVAAISSGYIRMANGDQAPLTVGYFPLGVQYQYHYCWGNVVNATSIGFWTPTGIAYNESQTLSDSIGLHIGSVAHGYTGSLILGGYDQGRAIGPATEFGASPPQLLDIIIGVELGGSPFSFQRKAGLLMDANGAPSPIPVEIDPQLPYIYLSQQTCQNLAQVLPIYFDATSGYYLWDNSSTDYQSIVSSSAYLGFVFPPPSGSSGNVTIKVPFGLLNLTLTPPAVPEEVLYFPCMPYNPYPGPFHLGRAFLQSAYLVQNHNLQINWLAQAAGPGASGLGASVVDLDATGTSLKLDSDESLFAASWAQYWQPLPGGSAGPSNASATSTLPTQSSTSAPAQTSSVSSPHDNDGSGLKIGLGVGISLGVLLLISCAMGAVCYHRRKQSAAQAKQAYSNGSTEAWAKETSTTHTGSVSNENAQQASELVAERRAELDALTELGSGRSPTAATMRHELWGGSQSSHGLGQ